MQMHRFYPADFISASESVKLKRAGKWLRGIVIASLAMFAKDKLNEVFDAVWSLVAGIILKPA